MVQSPSVSTADRLGFTLFFAAAVHAVFVLGVTFTQPDKALTPPTLEVTLARYKSMEKPDKADYIAQANQQGSGTLDKAALPSSDQKAQFQSDLIREVTPQPQNAAQSVAVQALLDYVTTRESKTPITPLVELTEKKQQPKDMQGNAEVLIDLQEDIASLEAQFNRQREAYAKRPKIKRLTAASAMQEDGALYKEVWRRKVEQVGNLNYPEQARREKLYGELRLMVAIERNGHLKSVEILASSGKLVLDDAAVRIVKESAPFEPFDDTLKEYDIVEIIRTWRFEPGDTIITEG